MAANGGPRLDGVSCNFRAEQSLCATRNRCCSRSSASSSPRPAGGGASTQANGGTISELGSDPGSAKPTPCWASKMALVERGVEVPTSALSYLAGPHRAEKVSHDKLREAASEPGQDPTTGRRGNSGNKKKKNAGISSPKLTHERVPFFFPPPWSCPKV